MEFRNFGGTDSCCDSLYDNENYDTPFMVETDYGERYLVTLTWEQGRCCNYRFIHGADSCNYTNADVIWPEQITKVEKR
ncbi:hypothetical protein AVV36_gp185 [Pectobacterium bacteriophage PM2]|uniref:Uncharacterized protein n=1 Tax=Pectobacterium bacteriophage PM2 TaxID=1429794 RepID=A0A0A0Q2H9_9CAUD|nr:hypothetical protein AVV36_gp185 [Pectobacterium bacteriophage PM2]AHY25225.1 hypothetical protein PM2_263 [Pectobacterium bacteriophage PM2]